MKNRAATLWFALAAPLLIPPASAWAQSDVADVPSSQRRVGGDEHKKYILIGRKKDQPAPDAGYGLLIVMTGGDGGKGFESFVKRIHKNALPDGYLIAEPVAPMWVKQQEVTWPTKKGQVPKAKFLTQEFVSGMIDDIAKNEKLNPARCFVLGWSSGGPAAYVLALEEKRIGGAFAAMSVFKPDQLPSLDRAEGKAFYIYHSPDDQVCPPQMAKDAQTELKAKGANVELASYPGGHGWRGNVFGDIQAGIKWLETNGRKPQP